MEKERIIYQDLGHRVPEVKYCQPQTILGNKLADLLVKQHGWHEWNNGQNALVLWIDEVHGLLTWTDIKTVVGKMRRQLEDRLRKNEFLVLAISKVWRELHN